MAPVLILPLNAPLPTAWYFPFQFDTGIQTSILISESEDGFNVAATRHDSASVFAAVIVVAGNVSADSPSHEPAASTRMDASPLVKSQAANPHNKPPRTQRITLFICISLQIV